RTRGRSPRPRRRAPRGSGSAAGTRARVPTPSYRPTPSRRHRLGEAQPAHGAGSALDVPLVPEREREQAPELAAQILASGDVVVEQARHRLRPEEALTAQRLGREDVACERLELAAEPRRGGNREAALAAADDLAWKQRLRGFAQQHFLAQAAKLHPRRQ